MKTLSVKLPGSLASWLTKRSKELGRTQSDLVREALEAKKEARDASSVKPCAELLAEFEGYFDGPSDLSTNPKYLKDLGNEAHPGG